LDLINKTIVRATYNIGSANISRLYQQNASNLQAITPFTTRGLGKKIFSNTVRAKQSTLKTATVTALTLNVRNQPSTNAKVIDKYHQGETIQVHSSFIRKGVSWTKVHSESGIACYVATKYIRYLD
ncbi:MAG: SH3 domain-containing protein, partial [bacterium]